MAKNKEEEVFPELDEELLNLKLFPVLIRPNLGQPDFIHARNFELKELGTKKVPPLLDFEFDGLISACDQSSMDDIFNAIDERLFIYPLSQQIVNGRAVRLNKIPMIIKEIKKTKIIPIDHEKYCGQPQIYLESEKVFPGRENFFFAKFMFRAPSELFHKKLDIGFGKTTEKQLREYVICDIVYDLTEEGIFKIDSTDDNYIKYYCQNNGDPPKSLMRINYHALTLSLKSSDEMSNLNIWQASDLHIAARNDKLPHSIFKRMSTNGMRRKDLEQGKENAQKFEEFIMRSYGPDELIHSINSRIKNKESYVYCLSEDDTPYEHDENDLPYSDEDFFWHLPVEYRIQNMNNNLRMFIFEANEAYMRGELDLIVFTGDLVDFVSPRRVKSYQFKYSNWKTLLDILLGKPTKIDNAGLLPSEELLVPIFTIPGNHDYRGHSYPPSFARELLGLKEDEIKQYPSSKLTYLKSLSANIKYLRGYFQFINPDLNFAKKFGKTHLIFLDSDKDSVLDLYDLLQGSPSTRGLHNQQIRWLKKYCNKNVKDDESIILLCHSPPLNPPKLSITRPVIEKLFPEYKRKEIETGTKQISINLLKEYSLIDKFDDPRIDPLVNLKFGTIIRNWEELLEFSLNSKDHGINKKVSLILSGHSHKNLEFRLQTLRGREIAKTPYLEILPFYKLKIPCAVYLGNYANEYAAEIKYIDSLNSEQKQRRIMDHHLIINAHPFVLVTTALGPRSSREYSSIQAYRKIVINQNRIDSFNTQPLLRYFAPFDLICQKVSKET